MDAVEAWGWFTWAGVVLGLTIGGFAKGATGLGLPLVAVSAISPFVPIPLAVALMPVAILVTNLVQTLQAGRIRDVAQRFWPLMVALIPSTALGVHVLATADSRVLTGVLGLVVIAFALWSLVNPGLRLARRWEWPVAPISGLASGLLGGISGAFGPPIQIYLTALHTEKELFVAAVGLTHLVAGVSLCAFLLLMGVLDGAGFLGSALAVAPVVAGQLIGAALRRRIGQALFRKIILVVLLIGGGNLLRSALV